MSEVPFPIQNRKPDYVIAVEELDFILHEDEKQIGFQYVDKAGKCYFIPVSGRWVPRLRKRLEDAVQRLPAILEWGTPPVDEIR